MKRTVILILCVAAAAGLLAAQANRAARAEHRLAETYQAALDEACETLDTLTLSLDKLLLSNDGAMQASLLAGISVAGASLEHSLATLPVDHSALTQTMAFANRVAGYAEALLPQLASGNPLPAQDLAALQEEHAACARLSGELTLARQAIAFNAASFALTDSPVAYPVAAYPGRYGSTVRAPAERSEPDISPQEAVALAKALFPADRLVRAEYSRTGGLPAAHEVMLDLGDVTIDAAFTVAGGRLLWMMPRQAAFSGSADDDDCIRAANAFLARAGFEDMTPVWQERSGGLCLLTYAAMQQGVTLYADLVRVQVRTDAVEVVGLEATPYQQYHEPRRLPDPVLSSAQAAARLSSEAQVQATRLCLLPLYGEEVLCHEFDVAREGERYLIFLDAQTGREVLIRKLVSTGSGVRPA